MVLAASRLLHVLPEDVARGAQGQRGSGGESNLEKEGDAGTRYLPQGRCSKGNEPVPGEKTPRDCTDEVPGRIKFMEKEGRAVGARGGRGDGESVFNGGQSLSLRW